MRLRLGTFNVWGLPAPFARHAEQRIEKVAARLSDIDLDVLLIQEAWTTWVRERLMRAARDAGFHVSASRADVASGGLLALSRLPIREPRFERFVFRGDPERVLDGEYLGGKGFLAMALDTPEGPIHVVDTHLLAHYRRNQPPLDSAVRTVQLLQIVRALRALEGLVVIGGDFNCLRSDPEYEIFTGLTGAVEVGEHGTQLATISRSNSYKRHRSAGDERIDFLFVRAAPDAWSAEAPRLLFNDPVRIEGRERALSDHFGFASVLDLIASAEDSTKQVTPNPHAVALAQSLLDVGRAAMLHRQRQEFRDGGTWLAAAALAVGSCRLPPVDRRSFLRGVAQALALVTMAPAAGYTSLARLDGAHKLDAFDQAEGTLAQLEAHGMRSSLGRTSVLGQD
jgi:endonuclease/exonuclease/phosphatase family metal-dependent hydrolase